MLRRWCIPLAGLAMAAGSLALAAPAAAAGHVPARHLVRPTIHFVGPAAHGTGPLSVRGRTHTNIMSSNWSGYAAHSGTYTSVSASWVEPTGTCRSGHQYSVFWVGLDGYTSSTVEQTGSEVDCSGGSPQYYSWYEMYPAPSHNFSNPVSPGDHFTGSVTYNGGGSFTLKLSDTTQGWTHTVTKTLSSAKRNSAEVIAEAPCCTAGGGILPLTDFGKVNFTGASANGSPIGNFSPTKINMGSGGVTKATTSSLSGGQDFSVTWKHS
jgi:Peptidase A4 family